MLSLIGRELLKDVIGRQNFRLKKTPERVIRVILAHVRRRSQQQEVVCPPREGPFIIARVNPGYCFGKPKACGLANPHIISAIRGELVRLIKDD